MTAHISQNGAFEGTAVMDLSSRIAERCVVLIGFEGLQTLDLVGPMEVFTKANKHAPDVGPAPFRYRIIVASPEGGNIRSNSGLEIASTVRLSDLPADLDTVLVAGGSAEGIEKAAKAGVMAEWLRTSAPNIRRLGSVCTGAFLLATAGILKGKRATTHWHSCDQLSRLFPDVEVEPDAIFIADGHIYTSAGVTAGMDLSLALVEQDLGHKTALAVARELVLFLRRPGGQSQYSASLAAQSRAGGRMEELLLWITDNPQANLTAPALAERAAMSERNFGRVFVAETGMTPALYVESVRVDRAKLYLETTDWPLARIGELCGFGSVATMIRTFSKRLGLTPDAYRQRFTAKSPVG